MLRELLNVIIRKEMPKKIHDFHITLRDRDYKDLMKYGEVICNSPFIRSLLYQQLHQNGYKWKTEITHHAKHYRVKRILNPKQILYHLERGRYSRKWASFVKYGYTEDDLDILFSKSETREKKLEVLDKICKAAWPDRMIFYFDKPQKPVLMIRAYKAFNVCNLLEKSTEETS